MEYTDEQLINWLDEQCGKYNSETNCIVFRFSKKRGWRLHEWCSKWDYNFKCDFYYGTTVRDVMSKAMIYELAPDDQILNWLDKQSGSYTGKVVYRKSARNLGWRLYETSSCNPVDNVRNAITDAILREKYESQVEKVGKNNKFKFIQKL